MRNIDLIERINELPALVPIELENTYDLLEEIWEARRGIEAINLTITVNGKSVQMDCNAPIAFSMLTDITVLLNRYADELINQEKDHAR